MPTNQIKVLVVDDEPDLCALTKIYLEMLAEMRVDTVFSVQEAMDALSKIPYDVIVSDYQMPGEDGILFLKSLRSTGSVIPFILFTGRGREEVVIEALNNGADSYLQKGSDPESQYAELGHRIKLLVRRRMAEEALKTSQHMLSKIVTTVPNLVYIYDLKEHRNLYTNYELEKFLGYTPEQIQEMGSSLFQNILHPDDAEAVEIYQKGLRQLKDGEIRQWEYRMKRSDGNWCWLRSSDVVFERDPDGSVRSELGVAEDVTEHKHFVESLQESNERFDSLNKRLGTYMDNAPEGIFIADAMGNYVDANRKAGEMLSYTREEILKLNIVDLTPERLLQDFQKVFEKIKQKGAATWEMALKRKDGTEVPLFLNAVALPNQRYMAFCTDITESKRAKVELEYARGQLEEAHHLVHIGTWDWQAETDSVVWSEELFRIFGRDSSLPAPSLAEQMPYYTPISWNALYTAVGDALANGKPYHLELEMVRTEGSKRQVIAIGTPRFDIKGKVIGLHGLVQDITAQKIAENILTESEARYRNLFDNMSELVSLRKLIYGGLGEIVDFVVEDVNPAALKGLGNPPIANVRGKMISEIFDRIMFLKSLDMARKATATGNAVTEVVRSSTNGRDYLTTQVPLGKDHMIVTSVDITDQKRMEVALEMTNSKLSLLSSITRHDIDNQTIAIRGHLALLKLKHPDLEFDEHVRTIDQEARQISSMIQFTKEYEDIGVKTPTWHDIKKVIGMGGLGVPLGSISIVDDIPAGTSVYADPLIVKVFHNLVHNAVLHGGNSTVIHFYLQERDGFHIIVCEDNGMGVSADMKKKLFSRCIGKDHGFGMFLSSEILSITGIKIAEEGFPGNGARFVMTIPQSAIKVC